MGYPQGKPLIEGLWGQNYFHNETFAFFHSLILLLVYSEGFQRLHEWNTILEQTEQKGRNENPAECKTLTLYIIKVFWGEILKFFIYMLICNSSQNSFQLKKFLMWKIVKYKTHRNENSLGVQVPLVETKG